MGCEPVTELPFVPRLPHYIHDRLQSVDRLLVCHLDCVGLTAWNDAHGWDGGDRLLRQFAQGFAAELDQRFEVIRLMGDVIAVCEPLNADVDPSTNATTVHALADRLMREASDGQVGFRLIWHVFDRAETNQVDPGCHHLETTAHTHRAPTAVALSPSVFLPGVGDHLHNLIARLFGQTAVDGCGCNAWIAQMNDWGPAGCREHLADIVDHLVDVATERNWTLRTVGVDNGLPVPRTLRLRVARLTVRAAAATPFGRTVVREVCREMVLLAIRQTEAQQKNK